MLRRILLALALSGLSLVAHASENHLATEALIGRLTLLNSHTPGTDPTAWYDTFMAGDKAPAFRGGMLGSPPPVVPPVMRELVRRGASVLPALLRHLGDRRPTRIAIDYNGNSGFGGMVLEELYDPRKRSGQGMPCFANCWASDWMDGHYAVTVGDLCFVLIGQIVNRDLFVVGYQPTAIVLINSPELLPDLVTRTRADWSGLGAPGHEASLLSDLHDADNADRAAQALERLRFYYPDGYAALAGENARKRAKFEADEKAAP